MKIEFQERSFTVLVADYKGIAGNNLRFAVPKLQCKIIPKGCSFVAKSSGLQLNLRKKDEKDNWFSLFKSKAIGERDSDDEQK